MKTVSKILRRIYAYLIVVVFGVTFLLLFPIMLFLLRKESRYAAANRLRRMWAHSLFVLSGSSNVVRFESALDPKRQYVVCPNHASMIDVPVAALCMKGMNFRFMAKGELAKVPVFGIFFRTIDIPVGRENKREGFKAYKDALESIDKGFSLVVFPEGTTSDDAPQMLEFKNGPFRIAIEKQVPIVPVTFLDNWWMFPYDGSMVARPGTARAIVHAPIETTGMTTDDVEKLKWETYHVIDNALRKEYEGRYAFGR